MMAAAATMLAACTQTDIVQEVNTQQAIGFDSYVGKSTRTEFTNDASLHSAGFKVWGYANDSETVFEGVGVTWSSDKWDYSGDKQYWSKSATYDFYATAPNSTAIAWDNANGKFTITDAKSGLSTESDVIDYLTATKLDVTREGNVDATVEFNFNHVMSKVAVALKKSEDIADTQVLKVTKVTMSGWNSSLGNYDSEETPVWALEDPTNDAGSAVFVSAETAEITTTETVIGTEFLIVPQTIAAEGLVFTVSYTLDGLEYNEHVAKLSASQVWEPNQFTTYTLTIGPEAIEFGTQVVEGWNPVPGGTSVQ